MLLHQTQNASDVPFVARRMGDLLIRIGFRWSIPRFWVLLQVGGVCQMLSGTATAREDYKFVIVAVS